MHIDPTPNGDDMQNPAPETTEGAEGTGDQQGTM